MKKIRHLSSNPIVIVSLLINFLFVSCNRIVENTDSISEKHNLQKFSGEEIFKGIFFLQGNFVDELNSLRETRNSITSTTSSLKNGENLEADEFFGYIISEISKKDPNYFINFKNSLLNDDLYSVDQVLNDAKNLIHEIGISSEAYGYLFNISDQIMSKGVDFEREDIKDLDLSNPIDAEIFFNIMKNDYDLDLETDLSLAATCNLGVWCFVTMAVAVQSVAGVWVYALVTKTKVWDPTSSAKVNNELLITELINYMQ